MFETFFPSIKENECVVIYKIFSRILSYVKQGSNARIKKITQCVKKLIIFILHLVLL